MEFSPVKARKSLVQLSYGVACLALACRLACKFCAFFLEQMLQRYVPFKIFPADFFRAAFCWHAEFLHVCLCRLASCSFVQFQPSATCIFVHASPVLPSSLVRAVRCAPVSAPSRLPCPLSPASPCVVPSAVCASVPAVRQPSAHQAAPVMPAVRLRQIKAAPVNGMGRAVYG